MRGTIEDHRAIALDVRELMRKRVFGRPVGSAFALQLRFPWLRMMRLEASCLHLELVTGRTVIVPLVWASCGVMGERMRLECPLCGRAFARSNTSNQGSRVGTAIAFGMPHSGSVSTARKFLTKRKIRRKLGDYGQIRAAKHPPKPRGMWRRT